MRLFREILNFCIIFWPSSLLRVSSLFNFLDWSLTWEGWLPCLSERLVDAAFIIEPLLYISDTYLGRVISQPMASYSRSIYSKLIVNINGCVYMVKYKTTQARFELGILTWVIEWTIKKPPWPLDHHGRIFVLCYGLGFWKTKPNISCCSKFPQNQISNSYHDSIDNIF